MTLAKTIRRKSNSDIEAGYIKQSAPECSGPTLHPREELRSRSEKIAGSKICLMSWVFPGAREAFPHEPKLRSVQKYFPYAEGGALLVDEPERLGDELECQRKAKVIRKLGFRYLILTRSMSENDARFELSQKEDS